MPTTETSAFNARVIPRVLTTEKLFRVYLAPGGLFFSRIGGPRIDPVAIHFGLVGLLIASLMAKGRDRKAEEKAAELDQLSLRDRLEDHGDNFREAFTDVAASRIDPPASFLNSTGKHYGRWVLEFQERKSLIMQFDSLDDMHIAFDELPKVLGDKHLNKVEWNDTKQKYVKKRA
jgi:hypothetical protein